MNCKNCGNVVEERFCAFCAQDIRVDRIKLSNVLEQAAESILLVNKGFFYTLISLFKRPGRSIEDFLNGKRKYHFKPIAYAVVLSTIYYLLSQLTSIPTLIDDFITGFWGSGVESLTKTPQTLTWFSKNYAYTSLLLVPAFSLASFLSFFDQGRNYLEHVVINAYVTGQQTIFYIFFLFLRKFIDHEIMGLLPSLISIGYAFVVFWQIFIKGNRVINLLRSTLTYILYLVFLGISMGLLIALASK